MKDIAHGLEGIVVAETALSHVDGERGELIIAGARVDALSGQRRFEEVAAALWAAGNEGGSRAPRRGAERTLHARGAEHATHDDGAERTLHARGAVHATHDDGAERMLHARGAEHATHDDGAERTLHARGAEHATHDEGADRTMHGGRAARDGGEAYTTRHDARAPRAPAVGAATLLGQARVEAFARLSTLGSALELADGMDALRAAVAQLPSSLDAVHVTAAVGVFAAAWSRRQAGLSPLAPDPTLPHALDVLRMIKGEANPVLGDALDAYLVAVIDHGMNASTFTARVIASTQSDLVSAVTGALGALKGPLHGGAPGPVLDMLDAVQRPENAELWLRGELDAGRRVMGMGHRVYKVRDPRAAVLERAVERLEQHGVSSPRLTLARAVEQVATRVLAQRYPDRSLQANVEFYTAVLLDTVGLPRTLFTPMFAVGRVAGWCAHVAEQRATGRLIRPESRYVRRMPAAR